MHRGPVSDAVARAAGDLVQAAWRFLPDGMKSLTFPGAKHFDFSTPEYATFDEISERKWESTRGVGHSFGANRNERPEDIVTATGLVRSFCDIVSKNGNLLIGIGPGPDGRIPAEQLVPLRGLGEWMSTNGEAVYGTRPWTVAAATTSEGAGVRFTRRLGNVYALLVDEPGVRTFTIRGIDATDVSAVRLLGVDEAIIWQGTDAGLEVTVPERLPVSPAHVLAVSGGLRPTTD